MLPKCALITKGGHLYVSPRYLKVFFAKFSGHLAARQLPKHGWAYFDRSGLIRVQDVAPMDNWASEFHAGLVRVVRNEKWGLADERGRLITSLEYDGIYEFDTAHNG
ncbi:MAG: WG repeat-containing protein [Edaphobacter sp.]